MTGEELRELRRLAGLTQQQLGELLGYTGRNAELNVQHWESGRREIPAKHYRKLGELLGVSPLRFIP